MRKMMIFLVLMAGSAWGGEFDNGMFDGTLNPLIYEDGPGFEFIMNISTSIDSATLEKFGQPKQALASNAIQELQRQLAAEKWCMAGYMLKGELMYAGDETIILYGTCK